MIVSKTCVRSAESRWCEIQKTLLCCSLFLFLIFVVVPSASAVDWQVGSGKPNYIFGFVAVPNGSGPGSWNTASGADVDHPDPAQRNTLKALIPGRAGVAHIFPRQSHVNAGLIASLNGGVVEPNASDDGTKFYITYYHDVTTRHSATGWQTEGADGYEIDMSACQTNPNCDLDTDIVVRRLTFPDPDKFRFAMNKTAASVTTQPFPKVVNRDFLPFKDEYGDAIVFVSNRRQLWKSNHARFGGGLHQFNLFMGRQDASGKLVNIRQIHYLTTTSAMSPSRASDGGFYFSYQANTEQNRTWTVWHSSTDKQWSPAFGIGHHLSTHFFTECQTSNHPQGNIGLGVVYYPSNNNGVGGMLGLPIAERGTDKLHVGFMNSTMVPRNEGEYTYTLDTQWDQDNGAKPGGNCAHGSSGCVPHNQRWGKVTTPRCAERDTLYFSWTYGGYSNHRTSNGGNSPYPPYPARIVKSDDVITPTSVNSLNNFEAVVHDGDGEFGAWWGTPLISFQQRFGKQPNVSGLSGTKLGQPTAIFGTSKLSNTENLPWLCYRRHTGSGDNWDPHKIEVQGKGILFSNIAGLNKVRDFSKLDEICGSASQVPIPLEDEDIGSIEIRLTSNLTDTYTVAGYPNNLPFSRREQTKVLGNIEPEADGSFWTHVPSNAPFDMILRDAETGMKLLDRTAWASLQAGQVNTSCGGCHQHQKNQAEPFEGTIASQSNYVATDILTKTKTMEYDASCNPIYVEQNTPSVLPPAFEDILPGLQQHCGSCHSSATNTGQSTWYVDPNNAEATVYQLTGQTKNGYKVQYMNAQTGALGSPAFWYAVGRGRLDGVPNQPGYQISQFQYNASHEAYLDLCSSNDPQKAKWVRDFGVMIDEGIQVKYKYQVTSPINQPYEFDRFHPSVAAALPNPSNCSLGDIVEIGAWDDSGQLKSISLKKNGSLISTINNVPNGQYQISGVNLTSNSDVIEVEAKDDADNRQFYKLTADELLLQCQHGGDHTVNGNTGQNYATPTPTPGASPTPTPNPGGPTPTPEPDTLEGQLAQARLQLEEAQELFRKLRKRRARVKRKRDRIRSQYGRRVRDIEDPKIRQKARKLGKRFKNLRAQVRTLKRTTIPELQALIADLQQQIASQ